MSTPIRTMIVITIVVGGAWFSTGVSKVQQSVQERSIKQNLFGNEPIKITKIKSKIGLIRPDGKTKGDDEWLRGLTLTVKNVGNKPITFIDLELHFPRLDHSEHDDVAGYPISYGTPLTDGTKVMPGDSTDLVLSEDDYSNLKSLLSKLGYPMSIKSIEVIIREVRFDDDTKWNAGELFRRIRGQPKQWEKIGENKSYLGRKAIASNLKPTEAFTFNTLSRFSTEKVSFNKSTYRVNSLPSSQNNCARRWDTENVFCGTSTADINRNCIVQQDMMVADPSWNQEIRRVTLYCGCNQKCGAISKWLCMSLTLPPPI